MVSKGLPLACGRTRGARCPAEFHAEAVPCFPAVPPAPGMNCASGAREARRESVPGTSVAVLCCGRRVRAMARVLDTLGAAFPSVPRPAVIARTPATQAYLILYAGFTALPILAGLDKFFHLLRSEEHTSELQSLRH